MGETHFLFTTDRFRWSSEFSRAMGRSGLGPADAIDVRTLREWINAVEPPAGLRQEVADVVVCAWAVLHNRAWYRYGSPIPQPAPGTLSAEIELRPEPLPATGDWDAAAARAAAIFGSIGNPYLTGSAVAELSESVRRVATSSANDAEQLVARLTAAYSRLKLPAGGPSGRLATAVGARDLAISLRNAGNRVALVEVLARVDLPATDQATAKSLATAGTVCRILDGFPWERLLPLVEAASGRDERAKQATAALNRLRAALIADELAQPLQPALKRAEDDAFAWALGLTAPVEPPVVPRLPQTAGGSRRIGSAAELETAVTELRDFVNEHNEGPVVVEWRVEP
jgi:hypothetical protein